MWGVPLYTLSVVFWWAEQSYFLLTQARERGKRSIAVHYPACSHIQTLRHDARGSHKTQSLTDAPQHTKQRITTTQVHAHASVPPTRGSRTICAQPLASNSCRKSIDGDDNCSKAGCRTVRCTPASSAAAAQQYYSGYKCRELRADRDRGGHNGRLTTPSLRPTPV